MVCSCIVSSGPQGRAAPTESQLKRKVGERQVTSLPSTQPSHSFSLAWIMLLLPPPPPPCSRVNWPSKDLCGSFSWESKPCHSEQRERSKEREKEITLKIRTIHMCEPNCSNYPSRQALNALKPEFQSEPSPAMVAALAPPCGENIEPQAYSPGSRNKSQLGNFLESASLPSHQHGCQAA